MRYQRDAFPPEDVLAAFWLRAWGAPPHKAIGEVLRRGLGHVCAWEDRRLAGFVNVATDGGLHAFILDTAVDPDYRRRGVAGRLVREATDLARARGAEWLHVDFEPQLEGLYLGCGFRPTSAGLIDLTEGNTP